MQQQWQQRRQPQQQSIPEAQLPLKVDSAKWYEATSARGIIYGPAFACLDNIRSSTGRPNKSMATVKNNRWGDEAQHHLHLVVLTPTIS